MHTLDRDHILAELKWHLLCAQQIMKKQTNGHWRDVHLRVLDCLFIVFEFGDFLFIIFEFGKLTLNKVLGCE